MNATKNEARPRVPRVGTAVRGSATGRPIMVALDLLGRRGALRLLWELRGDPLTFRALQDACATNPSLLNTRLGRRRLKQLQRRHRTRRRPTAVLFLTPAHPCVDSQEHARSPPQCGIIGAAPHHGSQE